MTTPTTYRYAFIIADDLHIVGEYDLTNWSHNVYEESKSDWDRVRVERGTWIYVELEVADEA